MTPTYADLTALAVLGVLVVWLLGSEPPRMLLRALRRQSRARSMSVEDV